MPHDESKRRRRGTICFSGSPQIWMIEKSSRRDAACCVSDSRIHLRLILGKNILTRQVSAQATTTQDCRSGFQPRPSPKGEAKHSPLARKCWVGSFETS